MTDKEKIKKSMLDVAKTFGESFDKADEATQKSLLDHAKAMIDKIDTDPTLKTDLKKERDAFEANILKVGIDRFQKAHKTTYSYTKPKDVEGDEDGKKLEGKAAKLGDEVHEFFVKCADKCRNFFSGDKKDDKKDEKKGASTDGDKKEKKYKRHRDGSIVLDKDGNPVEAGFFDGLDVGNMLGGLAGALGGWVVGTMFGGGWIGMLMGGMLAIGGMFLGKQALGDKINGWLDRPSDPGNPKSKDGQAQQKQKDGQQTGAQTGKQNGVAGTGQSSVESLTPEQQQKARDAFQSAYMEITGHAYGAQVSNTGPAYQAPYQPQRGTEIQYRR